MIPWGNHTRCPTIVAPPENNPAHSRLSPEGKKYELDSSRRTRLHERCPANTSWCFSPSGWALCEPCPFKTRRGPSWLSSDARSMVYTHYVRHPIFVSKSSAGDVETRRVLTALLSFLAFRHQSKGDQHTFGLIPLERPRISQHIHGYERNKYRSQNLVPT